jgi:hypothetical protein
MAGVLEPGGKAPKPIAKPTGVMRANSAPTASTRRLGNTVLNFNESLERAQNLPDFQQSFEYGGVNVNENIVLNDKSRNAFGKKDTYFNYLDPDLVNRKYLFQDEGQGVVEGSYDGIQTPAVGEYDIPTSTSNFKRPRTLAAGYDLAEGTVTVVFRDGTFYNYYGISPGTWSTFKEAYSKGPLLNGGNTERKKAGTQDGLLLRECTARGEADLSQMGEEAKNFFITVARSAQISLRKSRVSNLRKNEGFNTLGSQSKTGAQRERRAKQRAQKQQQVATNIGANKAKNPAANLGKNPYNG